MESQAQDCISHTTKVLNRQHVRNATPLDVFAAMETDSNPTLKQKLQSIRRFVARAQRNLPLTRSRIVRSYLQTALEGALRMEQELSRTRMAVDDVEIAQGGHDSDNMEAEPAIEARKNQQ